MRSFSNCVALGLPLRESGGYYGYSLALGSSEVTLLHLANAYRALANGGRYSPVAPPVLPVRQVAPALRPVLDALAPPSSSATSCPTATPARAPSASTACWPRASGAPSRPAPARTCATTGRVGWSARYTVGVWVGNASGAAMHDVSGSSGAAPVWAAVMAYLHAYTPSHAPHRRAAPGAHRGALWARPLAAPCRWRRRAASGLCQARSKPCLLLIVKLLALYDGR